MAMLREIGSTTEHALQDAVTVIGRAAGCDVVVRVPKVSARHAMIVRQGRNFYIDDLGSSNGTFVNGERIRARTPLHPGDKLDMFGVTLEFIDLEAKPTPLSRSQPAFTLLETPAGATPAAVVTALAVEETERTGVAAEAKLRAVIEISRNLSNAIELRDVLPKILESLFAIFPLADRGFILLRDAASAKLLPKAVRHRKPKGEETPAISRTIIDHALKTGKALLSADAGHDTRFDPSMSIRRHRICSIMCVPMLSSRGECLGVIQLDTEGAKVQFTQDELDVLVTASLQAARAVEMAQLHLQRRDLEAATQIQKSFLPHERPKAPGLRFFDAYASAQQIGGDYYDYIPLPGQRLAVAIGDVAGKGVPAALLMARLSAAVRFCLASEPSLATAVRQLSATLKRACEEGRFITFLVGVLDLTSLQMTLVNAGHLPPLRRPGRGGPVELIGDAEVGIPLGVFDRAYDETTLKLEPGDVILLATDGITEARNPDNDLYGVDRLKDVLAGSPPDAESAGRAVLDDVHTFAAGRPPNDDLTLIALAYAGGADTTAPST